MEEFILMCVEPEVELFYRQTSCMANADFDLFSIVSDYVLYRQDRAKVLNPYHQYGYTEDDREDGRILYTAVDALYTSLDERLKTLTTETVVRASLSDDRTELLIGVHYESTGPRVSDTGGDR